MQNFIQSICLFFRHFRRFFSGFEQGVVIALTFFLVACGGGGGSSPTANNGVTGGAGGSSSNTPNGSNGSGQNSPPAPVADLTLLHDPLQLFAFQWTDVDNSTSYKLLENADGNSGFSVLSDSLLPGQPYAEFVVPLLARQNASYLIQSCNDAGCTDSTVLPVIGNLAESIGYFKASNTDNVDQFGFSVSLSEDGSTLAVGAPVEDSASVGVNGSEADDSAHSSGAVYVFKMHDNAWLQQAYIKASNTNANDQFGYALSLSADGNTLAVSASLEESSATGVNGDQSDNFAGDAGAVYVFTRSNDVWTQQAYIKASNTGSGDAFGESISLSSDGDSLAVGAPNESSSGAGVNDQQPNNYKLRSGAVYLFERTAASWAQTNFFKAPNSNSEDFFGRAVNLSGDGLTLAVGAYGEDSSSVGVNGNTFNNSALDAGAAYVFVKDSGNWAFNAYIKPAVVETNDRFGWSVDLSQNGKSLAIGAYGESSASTLINGDAANNLSSNAGAAYMFVRSDVGVWSQQAYIKPINAGATNLFGHAISLSNAGDRLAVAAYFEESSAEGLNGDPFDESGVRRGAVYVFEQSAGIWQHLHYVKGSQIDDEDEFGWSVALSGSGANLAVGALREDGSALGVGGDGSDNNADGSGAVYVY